MKQLFSTLIGLVFVAGIPSKSMAEIQAIDDTGVTVTISAPATRIISLAPNLTEILFHIGAGSEIVGVVEYSDFPAEALEIAQIGASNQFDIEKILSLEPDLVVAWESGNPTEDLLQLEKLGLTIFRTESRTLEDIASLMRRLGMLTGNKSSADTLADNFLDGTNAVRDSYHQRENLRVFYQIWSDPIYTLNGQHLISRLIEHCGGTNIFYEVEVLAPVVSTESVIERDPEVIVAGGYAGETPEWLGDWNQWSSISAVTNNHLYTVNTDQISRMGPRILPGMQELCEAIDKARVSN